MQPARLRQALVDKYVSHGTNGKLYTCFIDFKKAFDSVWHDGLFYKLLHYKIGGKFYDLIKSLYSKTKCSIKVAEHSFQVPMPNSSLLLNHLCFGARFLQESRLTSEVFILAFWQGCVLLPWQRGC